MPTDAIKPEFRQKSYEMLFFFTEYCTSPGLSDGPLHLKIVYEI